MIKIAIVEDEKQYYDVLREFLDRYEGEAKEACDVQWFRNGMEFLEQYHSQYDLVLMDIEMPVLDGLKTARELRTIDETVLLMFITNMAQYAIKGYEVNAIDYVIKPLTYYAFELKMRKVTRILRERNQDSIFLPFEETDRKIPVMDILYVEINSHTLMFHTYDGISRLSGSMKMVEKQLDPKLFARCNSCYLVNLAHVRGMKGEFVLVEEEELKMSRAKKKEFIQKLSEYYSGGGR